MGKIKIKQKLSYPVPYDASVLHDLCSMRDDDFCTHLLKHNWINLLLTFL